MSKSSHKSPKKKTTTNKTRLETYYFYSFGRGLACFFERGDEFFESLGAYIFKEPKLVL
jgi:hypothetical protein